MNTPAVLSRILDHKRSQLRELQRQDIAAMRDAAFAARARRSNHVFVSALKAKATAIIAEVKRSSPSAGNIRPGEDAVSRALAYARAGAAAVSVLTEESHFGGSIEDLRAISAKASVPVLRKDFLFGEAQIYQAAISGADAILLITSFLEPDLLQRLRKLTEDELHMDALVEVHTAEEWAIARDCGATLVGVNNRNLGTLAVSLDVSRQLASGIREGELAVSESGISNREQIEELQNLGFRAFLVGESLMRADDPEKALASLLGQSKGEQHAR